MTAVVQIEPKALIKLEAELAQLRAENKWLREANKSLSEALDKARKLLPDGALI